MSDKQLLQKNETLKRQYRELLALKKKMKGRLVQRMIENCEDQMLEIWFKLGV
jgi:hypothetical protein